ncbi:mRNA cap guanine-N7 methyltransferase 2 isoform X3 [Magnolia sinica]|uniref:mRNA cap guanine-N7 methyltransferase 2 isoform X3 n=1 Tax=Magnolia sinica TaxID=86752 RepID=UPI00265AEDC5|nr:mRNA cap guanine-N7 methyltransferase 2 isoform X3 [Magnolia sinica]
MHGENSMNNPTTYGSRTESAHHRLYDFAKTALIKIFVSPYATVCDLYCGGGIDTDKWDEAQIGHYIGIDASSSGISEAREMWESQRKPYTADFCELDPCVENLESHLQDKGIPADIVCCLQHLQLCFETEERARSLLHNVSSLLKPGGYFLGITPDSSTIWTKYQKNVEASHNKGGGMKPNSVPNCIRSESYVITFEVEEEKAQFAGLLHSYGANFVDPRGKLLARSFDVLGLYTTFIFQKPDPNVEPPIMTPRLQDGSHMHEERERQGSSRRHQTSTDEEKNGHVEASISGVNGMLGEHNKGILGPGPADQRLDFF